MPTEIKIGTWNVQRPSTSSTRNPKILKALEEIDADILILSETNSSINLGPKYSAFATDALLGSVSRKGETYKAGENRVTIWSKYSATRHLKTCDSSSSICVGLRTPLGELNVYGTVIGVYGNRDAGFRSDLERQAKDWKTISALGSLCISGDFNISLADNYYYTKAGRQIINDCFQDLKISALTRQVPNNIDHVAISESFLHSVVAKTVVWNEDKKLSDHIGVCVTLYPENQ